MCQFQQWKYKQAAGHIHTNLCIRIKEKKQIKKKTSSALSLSLTFCTRVKVMVAVCVALLCVHSQAIEKEWMNEYSVCIQINMKVNRLIGGCHSIEKQIQYHIDNVIIYLL